MDRIMEIAARHGLLVVEDAAQGVNVDLQRPARWVRSATRPPTAFTRPRTTSAAKAGALCVNDPELVERAEIIREKGTNRSRSSGQVDKYTWVDVGSSYVPSEMVCAFLYAQLEMLEPIAECRRDAYNLYRRHLTPLQQQGCLTLPTIPAGCQSNYHMFYLLLADPGRPRRD